MVMTAESEIPNIDWSHPDVQRLFKHVKKRVDDIEDDNRRLREENKQFKKLIAKITDMTPTDDTKTPVTPVSNSNQA